MEVTFNIPAQRIADLMITAIEGGIGYWAADVEVRDANGARVSYAEADSYAADFTVRGVDAEDPAESWSFTRDDLARAMRDTPFHSGDFLRENEDAETADALLQIAAFKEIVYG